MFFIHKNELLIILNDSRAAAAAPAANPATPEDNTAFTKIQWKSKGLESPPRQVLPRQMLSPVLRFPQTTALFGNNAGAPCTPTCIRHAPSADSFRHSAPLIASRCRPGRNLRIMVAIQGSTPALQVRLRRAKRPLVSAQSREPSSPFPPTLPPRPPAGAALEARERGRSRSLSLELRDLCYRRSTEPRPA